MVKSTSICFIRRNEGEMPKNSVIVMSKELMKNYSVSSTVENSIPLNSVERLSDKTLSFNSFFMSLANLKYANAIAGGRSWNTHFLK